MSIAELGSIGEFVSGLAVLVTLIYLAIQIRNRIANLIHQYRQGLLTDEYYDAGIRGTIAFWMKIWEGAGVRVGISATLREVHQEASRLQEEATP
jgi:hypothetical protein